MMATALENNGATVYIVGRRKQVLEKAAKEHNVRRHLSYSVSAPLLHTFPYYTTLLSPYHSLTL